MAAASSWEGGISSLRRWRIDAGAAAGSCAEAVSTGSFCVWFEGDFAPLAWEDVREGITSIVCALCSLGSKDIIGPGSGRGLGGADGGGCGAGKPNKARKLVTVDCQSSRQVMRFFVQYAFCKGDNDSGQRFARTQPAHSGSMGA